MRFRDLLRAIGHRNAEPGSEPYREPAPDDIAHVLRELEAEMAARGLRIRVLERQLAASGVNPTPTPTGRDLAAAADVLDGLAQGRAPRLNTLELRRLAGIIRGLAALD